MLFFLNQLLRQYNDFHQRGTTSFRLMVWFYIRQVNLISIPEQLTETVNLIKKLWEKWNQDDVITQRSCVVGRKPLMMLTSRAARCLALVIGANYPLNKSNNF
ncbi:MAG: hypothetical protein EZS28_049860 [Streblomastix strix]|uniref:Uncharacterized protein n=1 Tax=Streblomastix strix TaxID=222440 RepID=A0A5J4T9W3_9EUKA|nr:MAG: hypothetical protein EZS28_049860 [Streblomastix strix]